MKSGYSPLKHLTTLVLLTTIGFQSQAKIWRINNAAGVNANFTTVYDALQSATVVSGDTLYLEPSPTDYYTGGIGLTKRITFVGPGYFLDPANTSAPANPGLQVAPYESRLAFLRLNNQANGSRFLGITIVGAIYTNGASDVSFEKVHFGNGLYFENGTNDGFTVRKCFFDNNGNLNSSGDPALSVTNLTVENNIFYGSAYINLSKLAGSGNLFRNNSISINGSTIDIQNCYIANNIFGTFGGFVLTNSTIKNNLFQNNPTLPGTATDNLVNQDMSAVYVSGTTGSIDSRFKLKAGSPAIGKGLTVGSVTTPDCGAYGATDPYILSGIPNIPTIYTLTVPTSIPSGSATMNITFSSKNNN